MIYDFSDDRQHAPATQRNRRPIVEILRQCLPNAGLVLEIASGSGEHACFFANHLPHCQWLPSDMDEPSLRSIEAWRGSIGLPNLYSPILLNVTQAPWSVEQEDFAIAAPTVRPDTTPTATSINGSIRDRLQAIVNINMIHISPWAACEALFSGAGRLLPEGGMLYLYGPFKRDGAHTAPSNVAFDESLRSRNAEWGVRDLDEVTTVAEKNGLIRQTVVPMPANNFSVIFTNSASVKPL